MALRDIPSAFIWGANGARLTPEQVAMLQEQAAQAQQRAGDTSPVGHWSQGAARVVDALGGVMKQRQANAAINSNAEYNSGLLQALMSGGSSTSPGSGVFSSAPSGSPAANLAPMSQSASVTGSTPIPSGEVANQVRSGLMARGLPQHVADAFVVNFKDESGLNPGINETNPLVKGSRGGYGLYQLTGPRRRQYEAFAKERGVSTDSVDAQLDFLMQELGSTEAAAGKKILGASNTAEAAQAIVNDFLRPAPEHRQRRASRYAGLADAPVAEATQTAFSPEAAAPPSAMDAVNAVASGQPVPTAQPAVATVEGEVLAPTTAGINKPANRSAIARLLSGDTTAASPIQAAVTSAVAPVPAQNASLGLPEMAGRSMAPQDGNFPPVPPVPVQGQTQTMASPGGIRPELIAALSDPYASQETKGVARLLIQQQQAQMENQQQMQLRMQMAEQERAAQAADPMRQLQLQKAELELEQLRNPQTKPNLINAGDGNLYNPQTGEWIRPPAPAGGGGGGPFTGNSIEAQALNGLVSNGTLTPQQALEVAGGKTITNPADGSIIFMTPQGLAGAPAGGGAPQLLSPAPAAQGAPAPAPQGVPAPTGAAPAPAGAVPASIPGARTLTPGKGGNDAKLTEGERKSRSLLETAEQDAKTAIENFDALQGVADNLGGMAPFGLDSFLTSDKYKLGKTSIDSVAASYLYNTSGATATAEEVDKITKSVMPRPGDSPEVIASKKQRLMGYVEAIRQSGGRPTPEGGAPAAAPQPTQSQGAPQAGSIIDGYRFKGGDPADQNNWEPM